MSVAQKGRKSTRPGYTHSEETKRKIGAGNKGKKRTEEDRRKMSEDRMGMRMGVLHHNWKGGVGFEPYCPKFNNKFKESIRNKFDRTCFLCGRTEVEIMESQRNNKKRPYKLSVHHVDYQKDCLCNDIKCAFVPLCISCHSKTGAHREYWEKLIIDKLNS